MTVAERHVPTAASIDLAALPPHLQLIQAAIALWQARAIYAAARLDLPDRIAAAGACEVEVLARETGTHTAALRRLLRALASLGLLTEASPGRYALTPLGAALRRDAPGAARATVLTLAGDWQWAAWGEVMHSLRTGESGLMQATGRGLFDHLAASPEDAADFNAAMVGMHGAVAPAVATAYDFSARRTVVDVGGGTGALLTTILQGAGHLRGVLFDLPATLLEARSLIAARGLAHRCEVLGGDFFDAVPAGHDAYLLAHVLHDWQDGDAVRILRSCRAAIAPEGRLLIVEAVLPEGDTPHHGKVMDLLMLAVTGGMERTADEFAALLSAAGFRLLRVLPTGTHQSVLEAAPA